MKTPRLWHPSLSSLGLLGLSGLLCLVPRASATPWTSIGPTPQGGGQSIYGSVSGRATAIGYAPDYDGQNHPALFLGTAGGGVWRSTNFSAAAPSWTPLTDNLGLDPATEAGAIDTGAIAIDTRTHPNTVYVGTGEPNSSADSRYGAGILKSTDGGSTWTVLGGSAFGRRAVDKIILDPSDTTGKTLYAASFPAAGGAGGPYGVYKSTDGGATWALKTGSIASSLMVSDLEYTVSPTGAVTLFAASGDGGYTNRSTNGIYRSTDGGSTWTRLAGGAPSGATFGRMALAADHTPSASPSLYAIAENGFSDSEIGLFYRSTDNGTTWTTTYPTNFVGGQGWYDLALTRTSDGTLYMAGVSAPFNNEMGVVESVDGGTSWVAVDAGTNGVMPHTDFHALLEVNGLLYTANDGGVYRFHPAAPKTQAWSTPRHSNADWSPVSVATGRLDGDATTDAVVANYTLDGVVSVLIGAGNGTFKAPAGVSLSPNTIAYVPNQVVLADFNKDGILDIATVNYYEYTSTGGVNYSNTVSVVPGLGNGQFGAAQVFTVGTAPTGLTVGDFNGDTRPDIATVNADRSVSVLLGDGAGGFAPAVTTPLSGNAPYSISCGDFNGDGKLDVAVGNYNGGNVSVLSGTGTGSFTGEAMYTAGSYTDSVRTGDVNGDGKPDLVTANTGANTVSVFLNVSVAGVTAFAPAVNYPTGDGPMTAIVGDVTGTGRQDIIVANASNSVSILANNGLGVFGTAATYASGPYPIEPALGDFDGDGKPDIVTATYGGAASVNLNKSATIKGPSTWDDLNTNIGTLQLQGIGVHPTDPTIFVEGSQDNGTARTDGTAGLVWDTTYGGDGGMARFDMQDGNYVYNVAPQGSRGNNFFTVSSDGGQTWKGATSTIINDTTFPGPWDGGEDQANVHLPLPAEGDPGSGKSILTDGSDGLGSFPFYPIFDVNPQNGQRVAIGSSVVYETTDRGTDWTAISTALAGTSAMVSAISYAPGSANTLYVGFSNGRVFRTSDDGATWTDITGNGATAWGSRKITDIAVSPTDPTVAYVTIPTSVVGRVYKLTGTAWTDVSGNLPLLAANTIALDPRNGTLFAGLDNGVYASQDDGAHWARFGGAMPNVQVIDLVPNTTTNILAAATHGRGAFTISIRPGDVNGDGKVDTADAVYALKIADGQVKPSFDETVRGNVVPATPGITLQDAAAIARKANGL